MNDSTLVDVMTNASPFAVAVVAVVYIIHMVFAFIRQRSKDNSLSRIEQRLAEDHDMLLEHVADSQHSSRSMEKLAESQTTLLTKIAQELVSLNAATTGSVISIDNAKNIIHYQWNWCRDETARLICNSIQNNHFRGRESIVARRVYSAWRKASITALQSVDRFEGLSYPYRRLYLIHAPLVWDVIWSWAVPLYHQRFERGSPDTEELADLYERICRLFDQAIAYYFELVEDIDTGELYNDTREDPPMPVVSEDDAYTARMSEALRDYCVGEGTRGTSVGALGTLKSRMRAVYTQPE